MSRLYLALGTNLGDRAANIRAALALLDGRIGRLEAASSLYETAPVGFESDNRFLNAAAVFATALTPAALLEETQAVEREMGRTTKSTDGVYHDRVIDLDLLALDDFCLCSARLTLPHPHLAERRFVLEPLCEIAPELRVAGASVREHLRALNSLRISEARAAAMPPAAVAAALNALMPHLTPRYAPLSEAGAAALLDNAATRLFFGRDEVGDVVASATLCAAASPTGTKFWVEDVVVRPDCRGRGYGRQLIEHLQGVCPPGGSLHLTSRPEREAANCLYRRCGFVQRATNVYRFEKKALT